MTASYIKTKVENKYTKLLQDGGVYDYTENMDMYVYTISIDTPNVQWQTPRVYSTMDPKNFFNANPKAVNGIDPNSWIQKQDVIDAYNTFIDWTEAETEDGVTITFPSSVAGKGSDGEPIDDITLKFKRLPEDGEDLGDGIKVTNEQVAENILYNDAFLDIDAVDVSSAFDQMLETIKGRAFTPVGGSNDFGAINAITYADPIGLYLEIKDGSIIGTADAPKSETSGDTRRWKEKWPFWAGFPCSKLVFISEGRK